MDDLPKTKKKRGPKKLPADQARTKTVSVRLNQDECALLEKQRGKVRRGDWLRRAFLQKLPPTIPEINRQAYTELARSAANLNQLAKRANADDAAEIAELSSTLSAFRLALLGVEK